MYPIPICPIFKLRKAVVSNPLLEMTGQPTVYRTGLSFSEVPSKKIATTPAEHKRTDGDIKAFYEPDIAG